MHSPGTQILPRPSPVMCESLAGFIPSEDALGGSEPSGLPVSLPPMDAAQEDLRDLLYEMRGDGPSLWNAEAPSFGDFGEGTQGFPSTVGWGSGGNAPTLAFGAGPSETFGAFATLPGQVTDTAGTPFHPLSLPFGHTQMHMQAPMAMSMPPHMGGPNPCMPPPFQAGNPWGMPPPQGVAPPPGYGYPRPGPGPQPPPMGGPMAYPYGCNFPQGCGMPVPMHMAPPPHNMPPGAYPMAFNPFLGPQAMQAVPASPFGQPPLAVQQAQAAAGRNSRVVPSLSPPGSLSGAVNNAGGIDGGSSGDEGMQPAFAKCRMGSVSSSDSGLGLQVVPDQPDMKQQARNRGAPTPTVGVLPNMISPENVVLVPYNGGYMAVRRPGIGAPVPLSGVAGVVLPSSSGIIPSPGSTRAACLARYRQKKAVRSYSKNIRYHMRKVNADRRPRVKGRFIKASAVAEVAEALNNEMDAEESL